MTKYAIHTANGYVAGIFGSSCSYCADSAFALTWPTMIEALMAMAQLGLDGDVEAVER